MRGRLNLLGKKFGRLLVISKVHKRDKWNAVHWKCKCECGKIKNISAASLVSGRTKSCGCFLREVGKVRGKKLGLVYGPKSWTFMKLNSLEERFFSQIFNIYRYSAKKRGIEFLLILEDIKKLVTQNCNYCGGKRGNTVTISRASDGGSRKFYFTGIDRIDSNLGYSLENCVPCCKLCNQLKMVLSTVDFLSHIKKIYKYQEKLNDSSN